VASASLGGAIIGPELEGRASRHATFTRQELFTQRFTKNNEIVQEQAIFFRYRSRIWNLARISNTIALS
jgi:hypothetical protein